MVYGRLLVDLPKAQVPWIQKELRKEGKKKQPNLMPRYRLTNFPVKHNTLRYYGNVLLWKRNPATLY